MHSPSLCIKCVLSLVSNLLKVRNVWHPWLSGSYLMLLAIWVVSDTLGYPGTVWCPWLFGYCLMLLAIWVLCDVIGCPGTVWCSWLSGYCLMLLATQVLSDALGYLGTVWCSWLPRYCLMLLAIQWLSDALSRCCLMLLAIQVLSVTLGYHNFTFPWTDLYSYSVSIVLSIWRRIIICPKLIDTLGYLGTVWCSWLSGYCLIHPWLSPFYFYLNWSLFLFCINCVNHLKKNYH